MMHSRWKQERPGSRCEQSLATGSAVKLSSQDLEFKALGNVC